MIGRDRALTIGAFLTLAVLAGGCARESERASDRPAAAAPVITACVSIPPQAFFVERIGGTRVSVEVLVGPGQSPATYEPTPAQMAALDRADVFFRIGVPFEDALMDRISASMPRLNVVDLRKGIELQPIADHGGDHAHGREDPHTWLDPALAAIQARTIHEELARLDRNAAGTYAANLEALSSDLEQVQAEVAETLASLQGRRMFVFHPAFGYFARAFGLEQVAIEIEGREPAPRELQQIIEMAKDEDLRVIFVQPEFSDASARAIAAEVGAEVVSIDPLARDYLDNLREMARAIRDGLTAHGDQ
ncbi:MAG: metal ABC transporter solute-binding protein, Zn/Mn family [Armatimonadota bacterium]